MQYDVFRSSNLSTEIVEPSNLWLGGVVVRAADFASSDPGWCIAG